MQDPTYVPIPFFLPFNFYFCPNATRPHTTITYLHLHHSSSTHPPANKNPPQSQAIVTPHAIYVSGQLPAHADGTLPDVSIAEKTRLCIANINAILTAAGSDISKVVKVYNSPPPNPLPFTNLPSPPTNKCREPVNRKKRHRGSMEAKEKG